jgi:FkbM family methyltransferase
VFESYAQNSEDIVLWRVLDSIDGGVYVDVGAADPDDDSVTKAFYERGWRGLNVEPAPDHAARLALERPRDVLVQACAGAATGSIVLHHVIGTGLSSVIETTGAVDDQDLVIEDIEVPMRRLDDLLEEAGFVPEQDIHFLKIDVEGFEKSVIEGIDLTVWRPWIILAESTKPRSTEQNHHEWEPLLTDRGYEFCLFDGLNRFYLAEEHAELRDLLSFPAGVFDHPFLTPPHAALMREYHNLAEGNERLQGVYDEAIESHEALIAEFDRTLAAHTDLAATHERTLEAHAALEATHAETIAAYQALEATHGETIAGHQRLQAIYDDAIESYQRLDALYEALQTDHRELEAAVAALRDGVSRMGAEIDSLRSERDVARTELELTRQTLSWRVTRPLRAVRGLQSG